MVRFSKESSGSFSVTFSECQMFQAVVLFISLCAAVIGAVTGTSVQADSVIENPHVMTATADTEMSDVFGRPRNCPNGVCPIHGYTPKQPAQTPGQHTETISINTSDWVENRFCRPEQPPQNPPGFYPAPGYTQPAPPVSPPQYIIPPRVADDGVRSGILSILAFLVTLTAGVAGGLSRNSDEKKADAEAAEAKKQAKAKDRAALLGAK